MKTFRELLQSFGGDLSKISREFTGLDGTS